MQVISSFSTASSATNYIHSIDVYKEEFHVEFVWGNLLEDDLLEDLTGDGRIILNLITSKTIFGL